MPSRDPGGSFTSDQSSTAGGNRGHGSLERLSVNLVPRAAHALDETVAQTGDSKTDTINRAIQLYAFIERIIQNGGAVFVRDEPNGDLARLHLF